MLSPAGDVAGIPLTFYRQPIVDLRTDPPAVVGHEWLTRPPDGNALGLWRWARETGGLLDLEHTIYAAAAEHRAAVSGRLFLNVDPAIVGLEAPPIGQWEALAPIVLEITEVGLPSPRRLHFLQAAGLSLAVDDWGMGDGAFDKLARWPIDILKLDRALLLHAKASQRARDAIAMVATFATRYNIDLVAEGVETRDEAALVRSLHIPYGQGFWWGRPEPFATGYWPLPFPTTGGAR